MKHYLLDCWIFPYHLLVVIGEQSKLPQYVKDNYELKKSELEWLKWAFKKESAGRFLELHTKWSTDKFIISLSNFTWSAWDYSVLQHELLHFVFCLMKTVGIRYSSSSEEVYTYLIWHLTNQLYASLLDCSVPEKKKRKTKN